MSNQHEETLDDLSRRFTTNMAPPMKWNSSITTFFAMISQTSSIFIPMFLLLLSVVEADWKGIFYIAMLMLSTFAYKFLTIQMSPYKEGMKKTSHIYSREYICNAYIPFKLFKNEENHMNQSVSTFVLTYTLAYLMTPMIELGWSETGNNGIVVVLTVCILLDMVWKVYNMCTGMLGVLTGMLIGSIFGVLTWILFKHLLKEDTVMYFNRKTGANTCKVKGDVKYTCDFEDEEDKEFIIE